MAVGLSSGVASIVVALISLLTVPMALSHLGAELYGIWLTVTAVFTAISLAEFGVSSSLVNAIASANLTSRTVRDRVCLTISTAFFWLMSVVFVLLALSALIAPIVDWNIVFNVGEHAAAAHIDLVVSIVIVCFLLALPFGVAEQINVGLQEGYYNAFWKIVGSVVGFAGLAIAVWMEAAMPWLVLSIAGGALLGRVGNFASLFFRRRTWMRPALSDIDSSALRTVLRVGGLFFGLKVADLISHQADAIIVAHIVGPTGVSQYAITLKLFMFLTSFLILFLKPLWPAYSEAIARGDIDWVRRTVQQVLTVSVAYIAPAALLLGLSAPTIATYWLGDELVLPPLLIAWAAAFVVVSVLESNLTKFYYAVDGIGFHFGWVAFMTVVNLPLSIYLTYQIGVAGPLAGSVIARSTFVVLPLILWLPRTWRRVATSRREK